jgi:hypothetical protein
MILDRLMSEGVVSGFTFNLFALRKMSGEPKFSITIRYNDNRDSGRGKGDTLDECLSKALKTLPTGRPHVLDDLIGEITFGSANIGVSGLSRLPGEKKFYCNLRRAVGGDLKMGRGDNVAEAILGALKK